MCVYMDECIDVDSQCCQIENSHLEEPPECFEDTDPAKEHAQESMRKAHSGI